MRRRQFVYNGQGIRHDGNYGLAKRIVQRRGESRRTVVIAFCGLDGSLLEPPVSRETEDWSDIESVLRPLLQDLKAARLNAGISLDLSIPVFHSTDSYRKHHRLIKELYSEIWPDLALTATGLTPKGDAVRAEAHL